MFPSHQPHENSKIDKDFILSASDPSGREIEAELSPLKNIFICLIQDGCCRSSLSLVSPT